MADAPKRRSMHLARKRRIWTREKGICWVCGEPVPMTGPEVRYDHRGTLWITQSDDDATIFPIHRKVCDETKTPKDQTRIAKTKRQIKMRLDVPREPSKMKGGGKLTGGRKLPGKGVGQKMRSRGFGDVQRPLRRP